MMRKSDVISYLKILGGLLLVFPLVHSFFALDFGLLKGGIITLCLYVVLMLIAIPMFNYLQYGIFWFWPTNRNDDQGNICHNCGASGHKTTLSRNSYACKKCKTWWNI